MADYGLIKSFDIDHDELDGIAPKQCFVLGYELAQIDFLLKQSAAIRKPVNADNRERIAKACDECGRRYTLEWMPMDPSEAWMFLEVAPATNNGESAD